MTEDEVMHAVQALVAAGEYLDQLPGVPGARLAGGGWFHGSRRIYTRGSPEHLEARAAGLVDKLPPLTPTPPEAVQEAERLLGHPLPLLLRRLYMEVGNGGFGPGYGILGMRGGHCDEYQHTAVDLYRQARSGAFTSSGSMPAALLPLCHWGCGIHSLIDCADCEAGMWAWDPNPAPPDDIGKALFPQSMTFTEWLGRWVEGRLYQPALVQDPDTGAWRGATDEEYATWMAES
jgi:SMI1 / KNR4 family (SUKH-1)